MSTASDKAAKRFFNLILPAVDWEYGGHKAKPLVRAAFALYESEWRGRGWSIADWEWPFTKISEAKPFWGDEPWTVLLQRAAELATTEV